MSFSNTIGKANNFFLKWFGLMGLPFYLLWTKTAVAVKSSSPTAGFFDIAGTVYSTILDSAFNTLIPGAGIILSEAFNFVAPMGNTALTSIFNMAAGPVAAMAPALSPGISP
jgi:hypothetical protein